MKAITRVILVLLGLLMMGTGLFLLLSTFAPLGGYGAHILELYGQTVLLYAGGALALAGLILLLLGFSRPQQQQKPEALLRVGEFGDVYITLSALENMVLRVVQRMRGIRDSSRSVTHSPEGLVVYLKVKVVPDQNLPDLTEELQSSVKKYLEESTGMFVSTVRVSVENIILDQVPVKVK